jgi:hypothetical protein
MLRISPASLLIEQYISNAAVATPIDGRQGDDLPSALGWETLASNREQPDSRSA